jgi:hypothetical protein
MSSTSSPTSSGEDKSSEEDLMSTDNLMKSNNLLGNDILKEFSTSTRNGSVSSRREYTMPNNHKNKARDECYAKSMSPPQYANSYLFPAHTPPAPRQSPNITPSHTPAKEPHIMNLRSNSKRIEKEKPKNDK